MPNPEMKTFTVGNNTFDIRDDRIGDLADLDTTDKSSVVDAINEAVQGGGNVPVAYDSSPAPLGTAAAGSSNAFARGDHVHDMPSASDVGAYALPAGGIPATDLAAAVQTSLGKADTAEQPITEVTISTAGAVTQALDAGKIYHFTGALTSLTITLNAASGLAHYHFDFDSGSTAPTVTIPNTVTMPDSFAAEASKHYEVDILNNYGAVISWANS